MNRHEIYEKFHDEVALADTQEICALTDLCHDGVFIREAGVEFALAVVTVADERGIDAS